MLLELSVDSAGQLRADMEPGYAAFKGAFGGWTAAHALLAAQSACPESFEPVSLSVDFLSAVGPGNVVSTPVVMRSSSRMSMLRVDTAQAAEPRACSTVLLAKRQASERIQASAMPRCARAAELPRLAVDSELNTWLRRFDMRMAEGRLLEPNADMRSLTWTRLDDTAPNPHAAVAALADASLPRIYFHLPVIEPIATVTMSVHFLADRAALEASLTDFVLLDARGLVARDGYFDQHVNLWSSTGLLMATTTQLARYRLGAA